MSEYDSRLTSSDLDAFKNSGAIQTASMTISGSVAAGGSKEVFSSEIVLSGMDFNEVVFDNSYYHSGKWHNLNEGGTDIFDSTFGIPFFFSLESKLTGSTLIVRAYMLNTTASVLALATTVLNFRYVPYEATL